MSPFHLSRLLFTAVLMVSFVFGIGAATAGETSCTHEDGEWLIGVDATGSAPLTEDETVSRDNAIQDALLQAVQAVAEKLIGRGNRDLLIQDADAFVEESYSTFIADYAIESEESGETEYEVTITVTVRVGELSTSLFGDECGPPGSITLVVCDIPFADLVIFEKDLIENLPGVAEVFRRSYSSGCAELEVVFDGSTRELADSLVLVEFTGFPFEVQEYAEYRVGLAITGPEEIQRAETGESDISPERADGRTRVSVIGFDDPFRTIVGNRGAGDISRSLQGIGFINVQPVIGYGEVYGTIADRLSLAYGYRSTGGESGDTGADWAIVGMVSDLDFQLHFTPPIFDDETRRRIINQNWYKSSRLEVSIQIVDLNTCEIIYDRSRRNTSSDSAEFRCNLRSDHSMIEENWASIATWFYVDMLSFMYGRFDTPCYVAAHHPDLEDRAVTYLTYRDGLYVEMPMRIYTLSEPIPDGDGSMRYEWVELCKVTVKEVYGSYSVIECEEKWFEYFEFGEGNNILWPVLPDRW